VSFEAGDGGPADRFRSLSRGYCGYFRKCLGEEKESTGECIISISSIIGTADGKLRRYRGSCDNRL
jgi:hypothetical protein